MTTGNDLAPVPFDDPPAPKANPSTNGANGHESFETAAPVARITETEAQDAMEPAPATPSTRPSSLIGRSMPHSLEAEEYLLSCCLLDCQEVIDRCIEARISPESFYDPRHGIVYERILRLHAAKIPVDTSTLAEELKTARLLDQVGGYAFIMQVSSRIPTTAQAGYFIEKVREQALLREIIRSATGTVEDCYGFTGGIDEFVVQAAERMTGIAERGSSSDIVLTRLEASRYNPKIRLPDLEPVFTMGRIAIFTRGNIATITAQAKSGKSSLLAGILASTFREPHHGGDTFTINGPNPDGKAVIHFDTEQHGKHHEKMMDAVMRRAGATELPRWFSSYSRKGTPYSQLREEFEACLKAKSKTHGGIHSAHLDGIADFCLDVNDPKDVNPLVTWLEKLAVKYDCAITNVLHLNPVGKNDSVQKARGHLGSQLQRKCETDLRLKKDADDITTVFTDPMGTRGQPVVEKDGPRFSWDRDSCMHMTLNPNILSPRNAMKAEKLREILESALHHAGKPRLRYGELLKAISHVSGVGESRAEARYGEMKALGVIAKDMMGFWGPATI